LPVTVTGSPEYAEMVTGALHDEPEGGL